MTPISPEICAQRDLPFSNHDLDQYSLIASGPIKKKVGDDNEAPKAPRLQRQRRRSRTEGAESSYHRRRGGGVWGGGVSLPSGSEVWGGTVPPPYKFLRYFV